MSFVFDTTQSVNNGALPQSQNDFIAQITADPLADPLCAQWQALEPLSAPAVEKELCAALLRVDDTTLASVRIAAQALRPETFVVAAYRSIASLCLHLLSTDRIPSFTAVHTLAQQRLTDIGGIEMLTDLANDPTVRYCTPRMFEQSCEIVHNLALKRLYRDQLQDQLKHLASADLSQSLRQTHDLLGSLSNQLDRGANEPVHIWDAIEPVLDRLVNPQEVDPNIIRTGFGPLDDVLGGGLRGGDLVLLAGRPSMGKTALAFNMAQNTSRTGSPTNGPVPTLFKELEMTAGALGTRALASASRVGMQHLRASSVSDEHLHNVLDVVHRFQKPEFAAARSYDKGCALWIQDRSGVTLQDVRTNARKFVREHGPCVLFIDYLQLIAMEPGSRAKDTHTHVSSVSQGLKSLAKELGIPIVALSQLNRSLEHRACKRPILADLRESGSLEQDADIILFVYRDSVYNPGTSDPTEAELIVAKQRDGAIGSIPMRYHASTVTFEMQQPYRG